MITLTVQSRTQSELIDITGQVQQAVLQNGLQDGLCVLFVPHTTAGLTQNENWDPDVRRDMMLTLGDIAPRDPRHRHDFRYPRHGWKQLVRHDQQRTRLLCRGSELSRS